MKFSFIEAQMLLRSRVCLMSTHKYLNESREVVECNSVQNRMSIMNPFGTIVKLVIEW